MPMPDVQFAERDTRKIETAVITGFEAAARLAGQTDFTLYDGDPRRLFLAAIALMLAQQNVLIDQTGKGNLLRYAGNATIEDIGWLYGTRGDRLQPSKAVTSVEFTLSATRNTVTTIPAGTRVIAGELTFATMMPLDIPVGKLTGQVTAQCDTAGLQANGLLPGQVFQIIDRNPFVEKVVNITESMGGADLEALEAYRNRIRSTPESFSTAGPDGAYEFWAKTTNPGIVDVDVWMPELDRQQFVRFLFEMMKDGFGIGLYIGYGMGWYGEGRYGGMAVDGDRIASSVWYDNFMAFLSESGSGPGNVNVVPLMEGGRVPTQDILNAVYETCNDKTRRPLTDFLHVLPPVVIEYDLCMTYWIDVKDATLVAEIQAKVEEAVNEYIQWQCSELGRAIIPDELTRLVKTAGVRRLEIVSPVYVNLKQGEVARLAGKDVRYGGLERRGA